MVKMEFYVFIKQFIWYTLVYLIYNSSILTL